MSKFEIAQNFLWLENLTPTLCDLPVAGYGWLDCGFLVAIIRTSQVKQVMFLTLLREFAPSLFNYRISTRAGKLLNTMEDVKIPRRQGCKNAFNFLAPDKKMSLQYPQFITVLLQNRIKKINIA